MANSFHIKNRLRKKRFPDLNSSTKFSLFCFIPDFGIDKHDAVPL